MCDPGGARFAGLLFYLLIGLLAYLLLFEVLLKYELLCCAVWSEFGYVMVFGTVYGG